MKNWILVLATLLGACASERHIDTIRIADEGRIIYRSDDRTIAELYETEPGEPVAFAPPTSYWQAIARLNQPDGPILNPESLCYAEPDGTSYCNASNYGLHFLAPANPDFRERSATQLQNCEPRELTTQELQALIGLTNNITEVDRSIVWQYNYDTNVVDFIVRAPFSSSFSQAINIFSLLLANCYTGDDQYLELALNAARAVRVPISRGGFAAQDFYEETPAPEGLLPYTLNGHMLMVLVLYQMYETTDEHIFLERAEAGLNWLIQNIHHYDTGYWTTYMLRPRSSQVYLEVHFEEETEIERITISSRDSEWTVCNDEGCSQTFGSARNGMSFRIGANLPSLRHFTVDDFEPVNVRIVHTGPPPISYSGPARAANLEIFETSRAAEFQIPLSDLRWSNLSEYYMRWHAFLAAELALQTDNQYLTVVAARWNGYIDSYLADDSDERLKGAVRRRVLSDESEPVSEIDDQP